MIKSIETTSAPLPAGHYSQATAWNDLIFVSGQLPIQPVTRHRVTGSLEAQLEQVLANLQAVVEAAGSDLSHIVKTTIYIADISLWDRVNVVYAKFFGDHKPARSIVPTRELHHGFLVEIEAIAVRKSA